MTEIWLSYKFHLLYFLFYNAAIIDIIECTMQCHTILHYTPSHHTTRCKLSALLLLLLLFLDILQFEFYNLTCSCKIKLILWKNKHQKWWKRITKRNTDWEEKKVRYLNSIQFYSIQPCILSTIFAYDVSSLALYLWLYLLINNKQIILSYTLLLYDAIF